MCDDDLPMVSATDILMATLQFQMAEISEDTWHEALVLELAGHEDLSATVRAIALAATAAQRMHEQAARDGHLTGDLALSTSGVLKNLKRGYLDNEP